MAHVVSDRAALRQWLVEMRERLLDELSAQIDGGGLSRLSEVQGALAAIDAEAPESPVRGAESALFAAGG
jgi:hypothetical protein